MRSCEGIGKNIEQAIQNALLELKVPREDVDIKILSEGGFLKKARVLVSISADAVEKYEKKEENKRRIEDEADDDFVGEFLKKKLEALKEEEKVVPKETKIIVDEEISIVEPVQEEVKTEKRERMSAEEFLKGLLKSLNVEAEIERSEDERYVTYNLKGDDLNDLIGHHGEAMLALTQIMSTICKNEDGKRVLLDVENYRQKRKASLIELAKRTADKVAKTRRYFKFEPMDASERKVIHTALQDDDRVTTLSKGEEPNRYLIVFPKEYED